MDETIKILNFRLLDIQMCIDIKRIIKVLPLMEVEKVPAAPKYIAGLMNLAGCSVTVVDLAILLGMHRRKPYTLGTPMILTTQGKEKLALIVDNINDLTNKVSSEIQIPEEIQTETSPYLGSLNTGFGISLLLDIDKIFTYCLAPHESKLRLNKEMCQYE